MNKKLAAVLAATCVLGATTAFAANPFSDVTPDDWAYQAVAQLAAEGVIDGYPDGTFKGERNITRYEMAQMVARAMARQEMVDAQQQAQINRLADEFANELNSLGVRVTNLENRIGNVKLTGDARVRYQKEDNVDGKFDMRVRVKANAKVSENTNVVARLTSGSFGFDSGNDADVELDRLYVNHDFGGFALKAGRYDLTLGATGLFYDEMVDGVEAAFGDKVQVAAGYAYMKEFGKVADALYDGNAPKSWYAQLRTDVTEKIGAQAFYLNLEDIKHGSESQNVDFWGAGLNVNLNDSLQVRGDYVRAGQKLTYTDNPELWSAGLLFGAADTSEVGSFEIGADYISGESGAYLGGSALDITSPIDLLADKLNYKKATYWQASAGVVPFENVLLRGYYAFDVKMTDVSGQKSDGDKAWGVELNYYF